MATTTIRLPEDLKARVRSAARRTGTTPHGFILDAIAEKADQEERRADFHGTAERRYAEFARTGRTIPWREMRQYLEGRASGKRARRPRSRKLAR